MIRILSGWSEVGGSTTAFINLTNTLNDAGYETIFMGPHDYPHRMNKCRFEQYVPHSKLSLNKNDILITHVKVLQYRPPVKKVILASHEKLWFKVGQISQYWDTAIFLHEEHYQYHKQHGYNGNYCLIPNLKESFEKKEKIHLDKVAGIIGSIEDRKKTHISIERALKDGCEKIYLYGRILDENYFNTYIAHLINDKIIYKGYCENKQEIYDSIGRVYISSIDEIASMIKDECYSTDTLFFGSDETNNQISTISNEDILNKWLDIFRTNSR